MDIDRDKVISKINRKKAWVFFVRKKLFKPIYLGKTKTFTGYQTLATFSTKDHESFEIDFEVFKGHAALILVQNDRMYILADKDTRDFVEHDLNKGWARIRLVGDKASIKFTIIRHKTSFNLNE